MKKTIFRLGTALAILFALVTLSGCKDESLADKNILKNDQTTKTITWGVKADTRLFGLMDVKDNQIKGFEIDLAKALTKKMVGNKGQAKFIQVTSQTRIPLLANGNIDAVIATMTMTPQRKRQVAFTNPYFSAGQSLLVKSDSKIKNIQDLNYSGAVVLGVVGTNSVQNVKKYASKAKVLQLSDYSQAFTALKSGQGQALTTDNGILYGMVSQNPGYSVVGGNFTNDAYGIAVSKQQQPMKRAINQALKELKQSGEYNRILHKWFGSIPGFNYKEAEK
ncbi:transporter substrate-binding domain-containing protein [Lentilactobacillus laojiaonis]|uniref:transporter substrate-binding domain-containing protein n=1 Tax=Lentilactobacillus laojiaonis TaxID=2883998 RepID=UPI001D0AA9B5|nr:transporter substrate-binding domain-containing protein [Lentilactobacillus laojiaonis]UDM32325.1 transporter substrate-binding domain-containing protein [Lentilactobacillus laojiaonis]